MNNTILNNGSDFSVVYYAVLINNRVVSPKFNDSFTAEQYKLTLALDQQRLAEVKPVDANDRQLLLG